MAKKRAKKSPPKKKAESKRKSYTPEKLAEALHAIKLKTISKKAASKKYGIPRTTLIAKIQGRYKKSSFGPNTFLTEVEEKILVDWLITSMKKGFPRRKLDLRLSAQKILKDSGRQVKLKDCLPGEGWVKQFMKRNPQISVRTPEAVTLASACVSEQDIRNWFKQVEEAVFEEHNLILADIPQNRSFNADESGFQTSPNRGQVLAKKGVKNVFEVDCGKSKEMITVLFGFSAAGAVVPPSIVYPYKNSVPSDIVLSVPEEFGIGHSETGWMTSEVYYDWTQNIFNPFLESNGIEKPVVLYVDGHKSHLNLQMSQLCSDLGIILVALYPNSTRILQPADVSAFKPLKDGWKVAINEYLADYPGSSITRTLFAPMLKKTVERCITKETLINGFRATGLHPWNPDNIKFGDRVLGEMFERAQDNTLSSSKVVSCRDFEDIVGEDVLNDIRNVNIQGTHINILRKLHAAFLDKEPQTAASLSLSNNVCSSGILHTLQEGDTLIFELDELKMVGNSTPCLSKAVLLPPHTPSVSGGSKGITDPLFQQYSTREPPLDPSTQEETQSTNQETNSEGTPAKSTSKESPGRREGNLPTWPTTPLRQGESKRRPPPEPPTQGVRQSTSQETQSDVTPPGTKNKKSPEERVKTLLTWPSTPVRKGKRNVKRMPFFISSKKYREEVENVMKEKEQKKKELDQRKENRKQKKNEKIMIKENNRVPAARKKLFKDRLNTSSHTSANSSSNQLPETKPGASTHRFQLSVINTNSVVPIQEVRREGLCFKCASAICDQNQGFRCDICEKKFHLKCNLPLISYDEVDLKVCDNCFLQEPVIS